MSRILWIRLTGTSVDGTQIEEALRREAREDTRVDVASLPTIGPTHVEYNAYEMAVAPATAGIVRWAQKEGYDATVIGCFYDPGLRGAREIAKTMAVTAPAEACLHIASTLGESVAILVGRRKWIPEMQENVEKYGFARRLHSFRSLDMSVNEFQKDPHLTEQRILETARAAVDDGADCIVLGCTREFGFYRQIQEEIGVPVIDPLAAPLRYAEFLADLRADHGWTHSKALGYGTPPDDELEQWVPIVEPVLSRDPRP